MVPGKMHVALMKRRRFLPCMLLLSCVLFSSPMGSLEQTIPVWDASEGVATSAPMTRIYRAETGDVDPLDPMPIGSLAAPLNPTDPGNALSLAAGVPTGALAIPLQLADLPLQHRSIPPPPSGSKS